jgi:hypothetical protein
VHDPAWAARWTRRGKRSDRRVRRERAGAQKTSRLHRPHPRDGPEDDGDRVFSIDERVTGWRSYTRVRERQCDTLATIERPTPNVRRIERRRVDRAEEAKNRKGERPPTEVPVRSSAGGRRRRKRRSGTRPEAGRLRKKRATRPMCAEGDAAKPQERRSVDHERVDRAGRDTDPSVVPGSADCFGAARAVADARRRDAGERATTPR